MKKGFLLLFACKNIAKDMRYYLENACLVSGKVKIVFGVNRKLELYLCLPASDCFKRAGVCFIVQCYFV